MIMTALDHYYEHDVKAKPSAEQAYRAISLLAEFLGERLGMTASVSSFGPIVQREFMRWSQSRYDHSPATIARNLSVVSASFRFGRKLQVIRDGLGNENETLLLDAAPDVTTQAKAVARLLDQPDPKAREWIPTFEELGTFIDAIDVRQENLFRFVMLALNTWARPSSIIDLRDVPEQVDRRFGVIDLNPLFRRQTIKYRPKIRLTDNLRGWLDLWQSEIPLKWNGKPITTMKRTFKRHAEECDLPRFTQGTLRHFMATMVRREQPPVPREQRDVWLGHDEARTADAYEAFDPEYLAECMFATEAIIRQLQAHTQRPLFACKTRANVPTTESTPLREQGDPL